MIEILQAPDVNRVIADGNDTEIMIRSTRGITHYFKVDVFVSNELILTQSWSKDDGGVARYNLKLLYYAYFQNSFYIPSALGFDYQQALYRKIRLEISEIEIRTGVVTEKLVLPEFYLIKNRRPQEFDDTLPVAFLDISREQLKVPTNGLVTIPLFIQEDVRVIITSEQGVELFSSTYAASTIKVARYIIPMDRIPLSQDDSFITVEFVAANVTIRKKIVLIRTSVYDLVPVFYENNFGMYISSYLTGKLEIDHKLKPKSYKREDGNTISYAIDDDINISLNSGFGHTNQLAYEIASSIDVRMQLNGVWERFAADTKKVKRFEANKFVYEDTIKLTKINLPNFNNNKTFNKPPVASSIIINGIENQSSVIPIEEFRNAFDDAGELKSITFYQSTVNGSLSYKKTNGQSFNLFYPSSNGNTVPRVLMVEDVVSLKYNPFSDRFGEPLESIDFSMGDGVYNSNVVSLIINIEEAADTPIAPSVVLEDIYIIPINDFGFGELTIPITVVNPDGFLTEVVWLENSPKITLVDTSNNLGTVRLSAANDEEEFFVTVRATDSRGLFTESTINIKTANKILRAQLVDGLIGPNQAVYPLQISNGIPGKSLDITFGLVTVSIGQYARIDLLNPDQEQLLNGIFREVTITKTFNSEGIIGVNFLMFGIDDFGMKMNISFSNIDAGMTMSPSDNPLIVIP